MASLVDTNVLIYRVDPRFTGKQAIAPELLERLVTSDQCRVPYQALVEFYAVVTLADRYWTPPKRAEIETLLLTCTLLYPGEGVLRLALHRKDATD